MRKIWIVVGAIALMVGAACIELPTHYQGNVFVCLVDGDTLTVNDTTAFDVVCADWVDSLRMNNP